MALNVNTDLYASPEQREVFRKEVAEKNYVRNFEVMLRRKDGSLMTAMESSFATRDANGMIERYQGFLLDITEKKRAEDEIRRRNRELNALNAMAVIATQSFDLDEILNLSLRQVISLHGGETGAIYLSDADDTTYRRRAAWGQRGAVRGRDAEVKFPQGFGDLVTKSRAEVITGEYLPFLPVNVAEFIKVNDGNSWMWVLLWGKDKPIGIMGLSSVQTGSIAAMMKIFWWQSADSWLPRSKRSVCMRKAVARMRTCAGRRSNFCKAKKCLPWAS